MENTWERRDLPVLAAVVEICDENAWGRAEVQDIVDRTGLSAEDVGRAIWKLAAEQPPFFDHRTESGFGGRDVGSVSNPTGHAQRTVGAWPTPESVLTGMIAALQQAAEDADDPAEKSRLRRAADAIGGVGQGVVTGVLTRVLTQGM